MHIMFTRATPLCSAQLTQCTQHITTCMYTIYGIHIKFTARPHANYGHFHWNLFDMRLSICLMFNSIFTSMLMTVINPQLLNQNITKLQRYMYLHIMITRATPLRSAHTVHTTHYIIHGETACETPYTFIFTARPHAKLCTHACSRLD